MHYDFYFGVILSKILFPLMNYYYLGAILAKVLYFDILSIFELFSSNFEYGKLN